MKRFGACLTACLGLAVPVSAQSATPIVINVVVTLTTTPTGASIITGVTTAPVTPAGSTTSNGSSSTSTGSSVSTGATTSSSSGSSGGSGSTSTPNVPGCASNYPQALATLNTFAQTLLQVEAVYGTDHAAGIISDTAYKAGWSNLLGIGLDAGAAHDMIEIGGDASDITAQIATVQSELATVTNTDLLSLVGQLQSALASAATGVNASAACAVSVPQ